jgi:hypothetical protein
MIRLLSFAALFPALLGCNDCDRRPCESFGQPASATIAQGIAGTVSIQTSGIVSGCQLCAFSTAGLDVWPSPVSVREASTACPLSTNPQARQVGAAQRYQQALDPGEYLICVSSQQNRPCIGVTVALGKVTTVNVQHEDGPTFFAVLDPGSAAFRLDAFECPRPGS